MKGQWMGNYREDNGVEGYLVINIDNVDDHFEGVAYLNPVDGSLVSGVAFFTTANKSTEQEVIAQIFPFHPITGFQCTWEEIKALNSNHTYSSNAKVTLKKIDNTLLINGISDIGLTFSSTVSTSSKNDNSNIPGKQMHWKDFKDHVSSISKTKYLFRGQQKPWKLRTSFHRHNRYRINEFSNKDVKKLHQRLSAITSHFFDLSKADQNGAFYNLLQHHGYPTPLLDWSYSPYVSAFFAFRNWSTEVNEDQYARIFIFDNDAWQKHHRQSPFLESKYLHLSVMEFIAIGNPRIVPQQSVTTATNIDDIEGYLIFREKATGVNFIQAIDIPASERNEVITDLRFMGITAASMFPGIDGVCEELKERNFE